MTSIGGVGTLEAEALPLLQVRAFRMLTFTRFTSRVASNAINFALVLLIVAETGRAFMSSLLVLALIVPSTVLGLVAGATADMFPRRLVVFVADIVRAAVCVAVVLAENSVLVYFAAALALASSGQFASSGEGAMLPSLVARERLARANAIGHAVAGGAQIVGFVLLAPAALRLLRSADALFAACAALFVVAAVQVVLVGAVPRPQRVELASPRREAWWATGWLEIRRDALVRRATLELTLISTSVIVLGGLIPSYIQETLRLPVEVGALVLMPAALGIVAGLRMAAFLAHRLPSGVLSTAGFAGFVALIAALAFAKPLGVFLGGYSPFAWLNTVSVGNFDGTGVVAMAIAAPAGFCYALVSVVAQTVINERVPLHVQGRVLATQGALAALASSGPVLLAGALADAIGVTPVLAGLAAVVGLAASTRLWRRRPPQPRVVGARRAN